MSVFLIAAMLVTLPGEAAPEKKLRGHKSLDLNYKWTGDFDGTVKDRAIRVLVAYSKTFCFLDRGRQRDRPRNGSIRRNIYKYYTACRLAFAQMGKKEQLRNQRIGSGRR